MLPVRAVEVLEIPREVVKGQRARIHGSERVEDVAHRHLRQSLPHLEHLEVRQRALLERLVVSERPEVEVVGDQWVHPVDRDELLRQLVRDPVQVRLRPGDAADHLVPGDPAEPLVQRLALQAPPVRVKRLHGRRVRDDRRRPVDRVDLRHQRRDDQARVVVELVVRLGRMRRVQVVADRVVFAHEQRMEEREPDPEVPGDAREIDVCFDLLRDQAAVVEFQLAVLAGAQRLREGGLVAVHLRTVPPVRVGGDEGRRAVGRRARVAARSLDLHRVLRPRIVGRELDPPGVLLLVLAVAEPVVHLELDPRAGEEVERGRRDELLARQQLTADRTRVRLERVLLPDGVLERDVAAEAAAEAPHQGVFEVVERAVERACGQVARVVVDARLVERPATGVVEVLGPQDVPQSDQHGHRERQRQLVPAVPPVQLLGEGVVPRDGPARHSSSRASWLLARPRNLPRRRTTHP